jgi:LacI family transcriptional regulator
VKQSKHEHIRGELERKIVLKRLKPGSRLPGERELAEQYNVSHMTARRAVSELVALGLLERRSRQGTFVFGSTLPETSAVSLDIICLGFGEPAEPLIDEARKQSEKRGWGLNVIQCHGQDESHVARKILGSHLVLLLSDDAGLRGSIRDAARLRNGRVVLLGNRLDEIGVPSVLCDDAHGMRLAIDHLRSFGHQKIAIVTEDPSGYVARVQLAAWRSCCAGASSEKLDAQIIVAVAPRFANTMPYAREAVKKYLQSDHFEASAFICLTDRTAVGTLAACHEAGIRVPEGMSLVSMGNTALAAFSNPPITSVDVNFPRHIELALEFFDLALAGKETQSDCLRLTEPRLVVRGTVGRK